MNANIPTLWLTHKSIINCDASVNQSVEGKRERWRRETIKIICSLCEIRKTTIKPLINKINN